MSTSVGHHRLVSSSPPAGTGSTAVPAVPAVRAVSRR